MKGETAPLVNWEQQNWRVCGFWRGVLSLEEKGYVDITKDAKGRRPYWKEWIDFLIAMDYLKPEKGKASTRSKIVYVKNNG